MDDVPGDNLRRVGLISLIAIQLAFLSVLFRFTILKPAN